ncbi:ABC transporter permease [Candidatus Endobugula sertula]|uniref:ABC transporter permease n=1 Tax=Candidatus Endobugula sertula TaxID=62101 RepID=A0A1D2QQP3_9GAMM|nr:ABC transporter permease [Candidatus Endobugula sertula]
MAEFLSILSDTVSLLVQWDSELREIILLSLQVSLSALTIAITIGLPMAMVLTAYRFRGERLIYIVVDTLMALPPVVVGLTVYLLLSRIGPLGVWGLLYTPTAMIIAQSLLITPIVIALSLQIFRNHWPLLKDQFTVLGVNRVRMLFILLHEARFGLTTVVLAAFGRAIAEIGAVMVVGGNIANETRVMTTAIAMETQQGNLHMAMALGMVLILLALLINSCVHFFGHRRPRKWDRRHA